MADLKLSLVIGGDASGAAAAANSAASSVDNLERKVDSVAGSFALFAKNESEAAAAATALAEKNRLLASTFGQYERSVLGVGTATAQAARLSGAELNNMQFQLQDVVVGLTSGQSPFTVIMQQGSQMAQLFRSGTGPIAALRTIGTSLTAFLTNPINLSLFAFAGLTTAVTALWGAVNQGSASEAVLKRHEELIKRIKGAWDEARNGVKEYAIDSQRSLLADAGRNFRELSELRRRQLSALDAGISLQGTALRFQSGLTSASSFENKQVNDLLAEFSRRTKDGTADLKWFNDQLDHIANVAGPGSATEKFVIAIKAMEDEIRPTEEAWQRSGAEMRRLQGSATEADKAILGLSKSLKELTTYGGGPYGFSGLGYPMVPGDYNKRYGDPFKKLFDASKAANPGMLQEGNIDLYNRPVRRNRDGSISTVRSMSFEEDGREILVPKIDPKGGLLTDEQAIMLFHNTGKNLGIFSDAASATLYANKLHDMQASLYAGGGSSSQSKFAPIIESAAKKFDLSADLLTRLIKQESGFNPRAVSATGAKGLTQLMPGTARDLGVTDPFSPQQSIMGGAKYLRQLLDMFDGNVKLALGAYNWGPGNMQKWVRSGGYQHMMPAETQQYIRNLSRGSGSENFEGTFGAQPTGSNADAHVKARTKAVKEAADAEKGWLEFVRRGQTVIDLETAAIGKGTFAREKAKRSIELTNEAHRRFGENLGPEIVRQIDQQSSAYANLQMKQELAKKTAEDFAEAQKKAAKNTIENLDQVREMFGGLASTFFNAKEETGSWGKALDAVLDSLLKKGLSLLDKLLDTALFGKQGTSDGGLLGGLLGNLMGGLLGGGAGAGAGLYAKGAAFGTGDITAFASGSAFTNGIVKEPTVFTFGRGKVGVMGEKAPEAVMPLQGYGGGFAVRAQGKAGETLLPLTRMANGDLGVMMDGYAQGGTFGALPSSKGSHSSGRGGVVVNQTIVDNVGANVQTNSRHNDDGSVDLEVILDKRIDGKLKAFASENGIRRQASVWG